MKEVVNTALLALIPTGSLLIHVPEKKIFLFVFETMCARTQVHVSIRFQGPILK